MLQHANLWVLHYLQATKIQGHVGLNMLQEVQEQLEKGNNQKQCQYYLEKARKLYYGATYNWKNVLKQNNVYLTK